MSPKIAAIASRLLKKQTLTKMLRLQILESYTGNCDFHQKYNISSKTPILISFLQIQNWLVYYVCVLLQKANIDENIETLNFSVLYGKLRFPSEIQLFFQKTYSDQFFAD